MRSEAEIRREVEQRFNRWVFLFMNGGLWIVVGAGLSLYSRYQGVPAGWIDSVLLFLMFWGLLVGLHFLRTVYVEKRDWLVRRAIEHERKAYLLGNTYDKRKRGETLPRLSDDVNIEDALVDFPADENESIAEKVKHGR
jgi:hypothetical protein